MRISHKVYHLKFANLVLREKSERVKTLLRSSSACDFRAMGIFGLYFNILPVALGDIQRSPPEEIPSFFASRSFSSLLRKNL
jgi:hypothetical protein